MSTVNNTDKNDVPNSRNNRNRRNFQRKKTPFITKNSVKGGKMNVPPNPPDIVAQPWNQLTLAFQITAGTLKLKDIFDRFLKQFDRDNTLTVPRTMWDPSFYNETNNEWANVKNPLNRVIITLPTAQMRIHSIRVWNITGRALSMVVYDYSANTTTEEALLGLVDTGSPDTFPRLGYTLPLGIRNFIVRSGDTKVTSKKLCKFTSGSSDALVVYVKMDWKTNSSVSAPTYDLYRRWRHQSPSINSDDSSLINEDAGLPHHIDNTTNVPSPNILNVVLDKIKVLEEKLALLTPDTTKDSEEKTT